MRSKVARTIRRESSSYVTRLIKREMNRPKLHWLKRFVNFILRRQQKPTVFDPRRAYLWMKSRYYSDPKFRAYIQYRMKYAAY